MAEIWGAAIMVGGGIIAGIGAEKKDKADKAFAKAQTKDEARYSAILSQFEKDQDYYLSQKMRADKKRGLDEFRKFSTVSQFAPGYTNTNAGPVVPQRPDADQLNF